MKLLFLALVLLSLNGCTSITANITPPAGTGTVYVQINSDRIITTNPALQGNVPMQGGSVTADQTMSNKK